MFFVVYFVGAKKFLVVPAKWVKNHQKVFEKSMNYSINSNQLHRCFFSNDVNENGDTATVSDFHAPIANEELPNDFCFYGFLVKYFANYNDAMIYRNRLRHQPPAIYNNARLHERPIPNIEGNDEDDENDVGPLIENEDDLDVSNTSNENGESLLRSVVESFADQADDSSDQDDQEEPNVEMEQVLFENQDSTSVENLSISIKEESIDPIAITGANAIELDRILGEANESTISSDANADSEASFDKNDSDSDDDAIIWLDPNAVVPKPAKCTEDVMPKRENDRISGNLPFAEKKNGDRVYKVGKSLFRLPKAVVDKFLAWLTFPFIRHTKYDRKVVESLLILTVGVENITPASINDEEKNFIRELLSVRVNNDEVRFASLDTYLEKYMREHSK